jgi:hypothetical protein
MGCWALLFYFKGTPSWILPKAFCRQLSPKYVFMQILKDAAILILLFPNISTNWNGATESLAPYKWCYQNQK